MKKGWNTFKHFIEMGLSSFKMKDIPKAGYKFVIAPFAFIWLIGCLVIGFIAGFFTMLLFSWS